MHTIRDIGVDVELTVSGALFERLAIAGRRLFGRSSRTIVARWDQIDLTHPERPQLTCDRADLRTE